MTSRDYLSSKDYLVLIRHAYISVHEKFFMVHVLLHSSIHELEGIQQARQLAYGINGHLQMRADTLYTWRTHQKGNNEPVVDHLPKRNGCWSLRLSWQRDC